MPVGGVELIIAGRDTRAPGLHHVKDVVLISINNHVICSIPIILS